jgi:hypothetical protein
MNYRDFRRIKATPTKYKNRKVEFQGIKFDSVKERNRYIYLLSLQQAGKITDLKLQVPFELQPKFEHNGKVIRAIKYVADFTYTDSDGRIHIEDTKGFKTDVYELKKKMMLYKGYEIEEV